MWSFDSNDKYLVENWHPGFRLGQPMYDINKEIPGAGNLQGVICCLHRDSVRAAVYKGIYHVLWLLHVVFVIQAHAQC